MTFNQPTIDYAGLSPLIALLATLCVVIIASIIPRVGRFSVGLLTLIGFAATAGLTVWQWGASENLISNALRIDDIGSMAILIALLAAAGTVLLSLREPAAYTAGHGAYYALLIGSVMGMVVLAQSINLISFFVGLELLSIPLYVLCGAAVRRKESLESGLKYLIVGSLGSATLLYGFALIYGATGSTDFGVIAEELTSDQLASDTLVLAGVAMAVVGIAFKLSLAPFHQWAPDVYEGAPTPITAFMAVATKAVVFVAFARLLEQGLGELSGIWSDALAVLAVISIVIGNVGAIGQRSIKRLLGYSGIAQGGYILVGLVVVSTEGAGAMIFYLAVYALANLAVFAPLVARERESGFGDDVNGIAGIGRTRPWLAWPMTIGVLSMIGLPGTAGFIGKLFLIQAAVDGDYTWLAVVVVIGTVVSLGYYLRLLSAIWMEPQPDAPKTQSPMPVIAGGAPEADSVTRSQEEVPPGSSRCVLVVGTGVICAVATVLLGIYPEQLVGWATEAGEVITRAVGL